MKETMPERDIVRWLVESGNVLLHHYDKLILVDRPTLEREACERLVDLGGCGPELDRWANILIGTARKLPVVFDKAEDERAFYDGLEDSVDKLLADCDNEIVSWEAVWR